MVYQFKLVNQRCTVIVTSTTCEGEPPDTALRFVRLISKKTLRSDFLAGTDYAILGKLTFYSRCFF